MITDPTFDPDEFGSDFDIFKSIIVENMSQFEHFLRFYEDLQLTMDSESIDADDEFFMFRNDAISGGLELFIGFSFSDEKLMKEIDDLLVEYDQERPDRIEFTIKDLTGRDKTLEVNTKNYEDLSLGDEFAEFF